MSDFNIYKFLERVLIRKSNSRTAHELELKADGASSVKTTVQSVGTENVVATLPKKTGVISSSKVDLVEGVVVTDADGQLIIDPLVTKDELAYLDGLTQNVQVALDSLDTRLDTAETTLVDHEGRIDTLETQAIDFDSRLDVLEADPVTKTYVDTHIGGFDFDQSVKEEGDVVTWDGSKFVTAPSTGVGSVKVTLMDSVSTALPSGPSAVIDGVTLADGDTVIFTNLTVGANRVYVASGVGVSIVWTADDVFASEVDPTEGDTIIILEGTMFAGQRAIFTGGEFLINETIRLFDSDKTDFVELSTVYTVALPDNATTQVFSVSATGSENVVVDFSILRGTDKELGQIFITHDGTDTDISTTSTGFTGVTFAAGIVLGNLELSASTTSTGTAATLKLSTKRWSDLVGGPTGLPNYNVSSPSIADINAHIAADDNVHGITGQVVGTSDLQTLSNKILDLPIIKEMPTPPAPLDGVTVYVDSTSKRLRGRFADLSDKEIYTGPRHETATHSTSGNFNVSLKGADVITVDVSAAITLVPVDLELGRSVSVVLVGDVGGPFNVTFDPSVKKSASISTQVVTNEINVYTFIHTSSGTLVADVPGLV